MRNDSTGQWGEADDRQRVCEALNVSRETEERLAIYAKLLRRWQERINLVAPGTLDQIWSRHFADSLQLRGLAPLARRWVDLGSGAGFPGLVVALDLPDGDVHLIESNGKKSAFLREVARETGVALSIHHGRIEDVLPDLAATWKFDIVSARALAPLGKLLDYSHQVLTTQTRALFLKGQDVESELAEAARSWNFTNRLHKSLIDSRGCVVEIAAATRR
jgi:16S rRNA (guanine527-N7)-methyltransferase